MDDVNDYSTPGLNVPDEAAKIVFFYVKEELEHQGRNAEQFKDTDVYVVWSSKVLQNWKALVSTTLVDGMYYEVTYNGDFNETYIDAYKKINNVTIRPL